MNKELLERFGLTNGQTHMASGIVQQNNSVRDVLEALARCLDVGVAHSDYFTAKGVPTQDDLNDARALLALVLS